jgi:hypothetical protein
VHVHCPLPLSHDCIVAVHDEQVFPAPHCMSDCCAKGKHVIASAQQPAVHELAVHAHCDPLQARPVSHVLHISPPPPHAALLGVVTQRLSPSQHPVGQVLALQPMMTSTVPPESDASRVEESPSCASTVPPPPSSALGPSLSVETSAAGPSDDTASAETSEPCTSAETSRRPFDASRGGASACESIGAASLVLVSRVPGASLPVSTRMSVADPAESVGSARSAKPSGCCWSTNPRDHLS